MSVFVNRNIGNKWSRVEVTDDEIENIAFDNFKKNAKIARNVIHTLPKALKKVEEGQTPPSDGVIEALIPVFIEKMITPLHFAIENYVDKKLTSKSDEM